MASVRMITRRVFEVSADVGEDARAMASQIAGNLQTRIASEFEDAMTSRGALRSNDSEYNVRKVLRGFDPRRGHRTGRLQSALYYVTAYTITMSRGRARVSFSDAGLSAFVPYAVYYKSAKVPGGNIMAFSRAWLAEAAAPVVARTERSRQAAARRQRLRNIASIAKAQVEAAREAEVIAQQSNGRIGQSVALAGGLL